MSLTKWNGLRKRNNSPLSVFDQIDQMMNDMFWSTPAITGHSSTSPTQAMSPAIDLRDEGDQYIVEADVPGIDPGDIDIQVKQDHLAIQYTHEVENTLEDSENGSYHVQERRKGSFRRILSFPEQVDVDAIKASYDKGILSIEVPKTEESQPRTIDVEVLEDTS